MSLQGTTFQAIGAEIVDDATSIVSGPDRFREEGKNGLEDRVGVTRICGRNVGAANFDHRQHFCGRIITTYNA